MPIRSFPRLQPDAFRNRRVFVLQHGALSYRSSPQVATAISRRNCWYCSSTVVRRSWSTARSGRARFSVPPVLARLLRRSPRRSPRGAFRAPGSSLRQLVSQVIVNHLAVIAVATRLCLALSLWPGVSPLPSLPSNTSLAPIRRGVKEKVVSLSSPFGVPAAPAAPAATSQHPLPTPRARRRARRSYWATPRCAASRLVLTQSTPRF